MNIYEKIKHESRVAKAIYGPFNSTHEMYGVLIEEVNEVFDLVRQNSANMTEDQKIERIDKMVKELIQVASVATRAANELITNQIKHQ